MLQLLLKKNLIGGYGLRRVWEQMQAWSECARDWVRLVWMKAVWWQLGAQRVRAMPFYRVH